QVRNYMTAIPASSESRSPLSFEAPVLEVAGAVDYSTDAHTIDHVPQRRAAFRRIGAREERVAQAVGERAGDALQQQDATTPEQRFEIGVGVRSRDANPDALDDLLGDRAGEGREQVTEAADHFQHLVERD